MLPERKKLTPPAHIENIQLIAQTSLEGDSYLHVTVYNSASVTVGIAGEYYSLDEKDVIPFQNSFIPSTDRTASIWNIPLSTGFLASLRLYIASGTSFRGQTWATVEVVKNAFVSYTVLNGYLVSGSSISFPYTPLSNPTDGNGYIKTYTNFATIGSSYRCQTPSNAHWKVIGSIINLTTGGVAANRNVQALLNSAGSAIFRSATTVNLVAGTIYVLSTSTVGYSDAGFSIAGTTYIAINYPISLLHIDGNSNGDFSWVMFNMQVGDTFNSATLTAEEWINPS